MANENMDMKRMQQEAIHRVQEMQNRANQKLNNTPPLSAPPKSNRPNNGPPFHGENQGTGHGEQQNPHHGPNKPGGSLHGQGGPAIQSEQQQPPAGPQNIVENLIDGVMKDSERTLIMIILLLLFNEEADTSTIFSLLYLLL